METGGWYNLAGGPFVTDPNDRDSDNDGLTDGEEKLFDTNPLDSHNPGIAVKYASNFNTLQYFSTTDPKYLSIKQGGDQYLLTEAVVVRRGIAFNIAGPAAGTLTLTGTGMTAVTPVRDPARGGWTITLPINGSVGTYTATVTDGVWSNSMPIYVIFELPTDLPQDQINAFLYDGDPANKRDEVAVFWQYGEWPYYGTYQETVQPCPGSDPSSPCSFSQYHLAFGYAQAYWTEQFTKSAFVNHAIKAIHGKTTASTAVTALANWIDYEFHTQTHQIANNWSSAMFRWYEGSGYRSWGGYCETTGTTYTSVLHAAGIPARTMQLDYNKTSGHGESGQIGNDYQYDTATMMWMNGQWYAQRAYVDDESNDIYYPWTIGTPGAPVTLDSVPSGSVGYYSDYYGDGLFTVNEDWTFQTSTGVGTVGTRWSSDGIPPEDKVPENRDFQYDTKYPLRITQSPHVDVLNCQAFKDDNWAPSEWSSSPTSNPANCSA